MRFKKWEKVRIKATGKIDTIYAPEICVFYPRKYLLHSHIDWYKTSELEKVKKFELDIVERLENIENYINNKVKEENEIENKQKLDSLCKMYWLEIIKDYFSCSLYVTIRKNNNILKTFFNNPILRVEEYKSSKDIINWIEENKSMLELLNNKKNKPIKKKTTKKKK